MSAGLFTLNDPQYSPCPVRLAEIEDHVLSKKTAKRTQACDAIAMDAAEMLLSPLGFPLERMPQNHKGFDILVNNSLKVQVKGCSGFQHIQGAFKNFDFDLALIIDVGITLKRRPADFLKFTKYPYQTTVKYYVFPKEIVKKNAYKVPNDDWWWLFAFKEDQINRLSNKVDIYRNFHDYHNQFDIILNMLNK